MGILKLIIQRKVLVGLLVVLVLLIGSYGIFKLDKELLPSVTMDGGSVEIYAGDTSAIELERKITTPLETAIQNIDGVESVDSVTNIGQTVLQISFEQGKGDLLIREVESTVHATTSDIDEITGVFIAQSGGSQTHEFYLDVSGGDMESMTAFAENILEPRLEALDEVRDVDLVGNQEQELSISFDREALIEYGLDISQVISVIQAANSNATLGELKSDKDSPSLRWTTPLTSVKAVEEIQVPSSTGTVALHDIAQISLQPVQNASYVWKNGSQDFILVQIGRVSDATQIDMTSAVRQEIQAIRDEHLISGFELNEIVAQADYVQESIDGVTNNILIGGIIAIVVLLLFLRNVRATLIIGISIPTSILLTFASMWLLEYSINILTLIGLGLGIGMMVDSSIVILESIYSKKEKGLPNLTAVLEGIKEVATAVIASMLTTIVVFIPIGLLGGDIGSFMIMLSAVVAITLISSVVVSFTLIPSLADKFLKLRKQKETQKQGWFVKRYNKLITWVVKKKRNSLAVIGIFIIIFVSSLFLVTKIPMTIMPDMYNRYSEIVFDTETGLSTEDKEALVKEVNQKLSSIDDVETNYVMDFGTMLIGIINMTKGDAISSPQKEVNEEIFSSLREMQDNYPINSVYSAMSGGGGYPVEINIKGESFTELKTIADGFINELEKIDGIVGVTSTIDRTSPEEIIVLNTTEIEEAGLTDNQVKQFIEHAFIHMPIGEVTLDGENFPLTVRWADQTNSKTDLLNLEMPTEAGDQALSNFLTLSNVDMPNQITHTDGERYISVSADIKGADLGTINRQVQELISTYEKPNAYSIDVAGDLEQQQELMQEMILVLALAIFLVYFVMAVQFNHLGHPLIVMSVIPMTIVGVIIGLFSTQRELSIMSGMGIVMLIGIVLNNAILLIDRTNQLRKEGHSVDVALIEAGKDRIRPIFLTTFTTVGGMLPLALATGASGNYQAPMATVIISGLLFATLITLLLIPAVYRLFTRTVKRAKQTDDVEQDLDTKKEYTL